MVPRLPTPKQTLILVSKHNREPINTMRHIVTREAFCVMLQRAFEGELKPLLEQLKKLEGIPVPDFGPLDDWAANRNAEMQRRARRAAGNHAPSHSHPPADPPSPPNLSLSATAGCLQLKEGLGSA